MYNFKYSLFADSDLKSSFKYGILTWGEEQAIKYRDELEQGRLKIQEDPYLLGSKRQEKLARGCRSYRVNHYYFFYRVNEDDKSIEIARILRENRNFPEHVSNSHFPE